MTDKRKTQKKDPTNAERQARFQANKKAAEAVSADRMTQIADKLEASVEKLDEYINNLAEKGNEGL